MSSIVPNIKEDITEILMKEYNLYRDAQDRGDVSVVEACMSPQCWQLSRQTSRWNVASRDEIMRILTGLGVLNPNPVDHVPGKVAMRGLTVEEKDALPDGLRDQAGREGWEGLHVVLGDPEVKEQLVEVNYYWRKEGGRWVQCLHDLIWVDKDLGDSIWNTV